MMNKSQGWNLGGEGPGGWGVWGVEVRRPPVIRGCCKRMRQKRQYTEAGAQLVSQHESKIREDRDYLAYLFILAGFNRVVTYEKHRCGSLCKVEAV